MQIVLPSGLIITAAVFQKPWELCSGLMGLPSMPQDHGALFIHPRTTQQRYWTFGCLFPLDIAWLDENFKVVEICTDVPPCNESAPWWPRKWFSSCPRYGGNFPARYVLEVNAGVLWANGVQVGTVLSLS